MTAAGIALTRLRSRRPNSEGESVEVYRLRLSVFAH